MKKTLQLIGVFTALVTAAVATPEEEQKLYTALTNGGNESTKALETVIQKADEVTAVTLFMASGTALKNEDFTNSAYLFYIAKFRAQFDSELFPPVGTGGDNPMVAFNALSSQLGAAINPAIMRRPKNLSASLKLAEKWTPTVTDDYNPGWKHTKKKSIASALEKLDAAKSHFNQGMGGLSKLLLFPPYFEAFKTLQDYNMKSDDSRPSKEENDAAVATMTEIEKSKGLRGIFYDPSKEK